MKDLKIETGLREYNLGGKVTVEFSPTDFNFVESVSTALQAAEKKQKEVEEELRGLSGDPDSIFEFARRRDQEMREIVNAPFGKDVCTPLFGSMNVFAHGDGFPLWANLLTVILDECYDNMPQEEKAARARIEKYTRKYKKR